MWSLIICTPHRSTKRTRWVGNVEQIGKNTSAYKVMVGNSKVKKKMKIQVYTGCPRRKDQYSERS
jgi:hypothetical protein